MNISNNINLSTSNSASKILSETKNNLQKNEGTQNIKDGYNEKTTDPEVLKLQKEVQKLKQEVQKLKKSEHKENTPKSDFLKKVGDFVTDPMLMGGVLGAGLGIGITAKMCMEQNANIAGSLSLGGAMLIPVLAGCGALAGTMLDIMIDPY